MKLFFRGLMLLLWLASAPAFAQATYGTQNGQNVGASAILVPCGSIVNGQPLMCPPGVANALPINCTNCSPSAPVGASSTPVSGTIAVTDTFQSLIVSNPTRKGCTFQNNGTHNMYFSVQSSPTKPGSLIVGPGGIFYCSGPSNIVLTDAIQITGTAGDAFAGNWQ